MDQFKQKFKEEATDLINDLEEALLLLEQNPNDKDIVERVFRAMHSLKGGGAMFGFDHVSEFTHHLETIYDLVREDKFLVSADLLTITLESVDHIKDLLFSDEITKEIENNHSVLITKLSTLATNDVGKAATPIENQDNTASTQKSFYVFFKPNPDVFENGTNPLYLLDELCELGESRIISHSENIPLLDDLKESNSYLYWEVIIVTDQELNAIGDVFLFVEDDCELEITQVAEGNLLADEKVIRYLADIEKESKVVDIQKLEREISKNKENKTEQGSKESTGTDTSVISSIRVASDKIDTLMNLVSELVTTQARLSLFTEQQEDAELDAIGENIQKLSRQLRDNAFSISLIPLQSIITRFQRLVRDLSNGLGKKINFKTEGTETELDKTIIENLTDPILHIIRTSIDHGIEDVQTRINSGKPEEGTILLRSFYSGTNVFIQIIDDGKGLDHEKIRQKAIEKNLISESTQLSKKEVFDLIFMAGFSTAKEVTDVSGRGVGMDVVKRKISAIRGDVEVDSEPGEGTTITIKLPLTLSIIDGLLVRVGVTDFIVPLSAVQKIYAVNKSEIIDNYTHTVVLDEKQTPFHNMREFFTIDKEMPDTVQVLVVTYEEQSVGIVVDYVVGEYQAVIKPLGKHYKDQEFISGATILGDGSVALVLDTNKIIKQSAEEV
ncbi:MAG: chemotaxis protein CheA [Marinilabiliales bacterium]|nr:MAG: chemotaxis protein CheA [Marinilabiliales bacterium]